MNDLTHEWTHDGVTFRFTWVEERTQPPDRVKCIAFTSQGKIVLVTNEAWSPQCWLPGGGVEPGESVEQALARELVEEANATLNECIEIGAQRIDVSTGPRWIEALYWSRVTLSDAFVPQHEISERVLVTPDAFMDTLVWGRTDPKARVLLERALAIEQRLGPQTHTNRL